MAVKRVHQWRLKGIYRPLARQIRVEGSAYCALGSAQPRAAARVSGSWRGCEEDEVRFEVRSIVDGSQVNVDGWRIGSERRR